MKTLNKAELGHISWCPSTFEEPICLKTLQAGGSCFFQTPPPLTPTTTTTTTNTGVQLLMSNMQSNISILLLYLKVVGD